MGAGGKCVCVCERETRGRCACEDGGGLKARGTTLKKVFDKPEHVCVLKRATIFERRAESIIFILHTRRSWKLERQEYVALHNFSL